MALTARYRSSSIRALPLDVQVPRTEHFDWKHRVYWKGFARNGTESRHGALDCPSFKEPCLRRWNDWKGNFTPRYTLYTTVYSPPCISSSPKYHWELQDKERNPLASFTNVVEAFFIVMGARTYGNEELYLEYKDHSVGR